MTKIKINLNTYNISGPIVVGVSTGSDSMALLHMLINNYKDKIIVAHINHNVRSQSKIEEEFLSNYCKENNITFEKTIIKNYKENNFENEARKYRYKFYQEILNKYNSKYLLLAHHADDLIETIIMKITRGSNLTGYSGIKKIQKQDNYYIIRPLLDYTKEDILTYINKNNIKYYNDYTNNDITYTRNRIRHKIIPLLKEEDKLIHKKFIKYSNTLNEYNDYINYEIENIIKDIYISNTLYLDKFNNLHIFLKKNILYYILNNIYNNKTNIVKETHINNIINLINNKKPNLTINMPNNIYVTKEYNILKFDNKQNIENYNIEFNKIFKISNHIIKEINETKENGNDICRLNSKEISMPLYIRNKQEKDYIYLLGLNKKKKIKDIFINSKIPLSKRNTYPILTDSKNNILWLPNLKKSKFNKKINEKYDIILKYSTNKEENNE